MSSWLHLCSTFKTGPTFVNLSISLIFLIITHLNNRFLSVTLHKLSNQEQDLSTRIGTLISYQSFAFHKSTKPYPIALIPNDHITCVLCQKDDETMLKSIL